MKKKWYTPKFCKAQTTLILKPDKDTVSQERYKPISLMKISLTKF